MLNVFQQYNEKVDLTNPESKSELKVVGSMDIKSFYPSIRPDKVALIARLMWNKSDCSVKNVDKEKLAMYVTREIPREKLKWLNLEDCLYTRKPVTKKIGRKQNKSLNTQNKSLKVKVKRRKKTDDEIWFKPLKSPSETEVKTMVGLVLENIIKISMKNHLYQFANQVRVQENTGPTGYDLTGLVADVYMVWWDERFSQRLLDLKLKTDINVRFKDDLNILTRALPLGAHYCRKNKEMQYANPTFANNFQFENKLEKEIYESKNRAKITFHVLNKIANDIDSMISFTNDVPENCDDLKMPVLDLKVI